MRTQTIAAITAVTLLAAPRPAIPKAVEDFQFVIGNETHISDGSDILYYENLMWMQKTWTSFSRTDHTLYFGTELLMEPVDDEFAGRSRFGFDTIAGVIGYKFATYLPDWYNFNIKLRIPFSVPPDIFGRSRCPEEPDPRTGTSWEAMTPQNCAPHREYWDRIHIRVDPLFVKKTWNLFTLYDRNRVTLSVEHIEYSNKLKLIDVTPDLDFPIAMYVGNELRMGKDILEAGWRIRNDFIVGVASNFFDWLHLGVEFMYHLDSKKSASKMFIAEVYLEFYFDIFFDNTFGAADKRKREAYEEARD